MLTKVELACTNTIIEFFFNMKEPITNLKLQKLYYFTAGQYLADYGQKIADHNFQAWPHGPVLPNLYSKLASHKDGPIKDYLKHDDGQIYSYPKGDVFDMINNVVNVLGNLTAWQLSERSHVKNGPWYEVFVKEEKYKENITWESIEKYFNEHPVLNHG